MNFKIKMNVVSLKSPHVVIFPNLVINPNLTNLQTPYNHIILFLSYIYYKDVCVCVCVYQLQLPKCILSLMEELVDG